MLSLICVPLYLVWLGAAEYGVVLTVLALRGYLMFADAGIGSATLMHVSAASGTGDHARIAQTLRTSFLLAGVSSLVVAFGLGSIAWALVFEPTWLPPFGTSAIVLFLLLGVDVIVTVLASPGYSLFWGMQQGHVVNAYQGLMTLAGIGAGLLGVWLTRAPEAILVAFLVCNSGGALACLIHGRQRYPWAFARGPWIEARLLRTLVRSAAKSFGAQLGNVLYASAPILAISSQVGPAHVPLYTVPQTLLSLPFTLFLGFNVALQAGYGEAYARRDHAWLNSTIQRVLRQGCVLACLLAAGFFCLGRPFVGTWTGDQIAPSDWMLLGIVAACVPHMLLSTFRFALIGVNRHRSVTASSLGEGALCAAGAFAAASWLGADFVGFAAGLAVLLSSAWVLPWATRVHLPKFELGLPLAFPMRLTLVGAATLGAGMAAATFLDGSTLWVGGGALMLAVYLGALELLLPADASMLRQLARSLIRPHLRTSDGRAAR